MKTIEKPQVQKEFAEAEDQISTLQKKLASNVKSTTFKRPARPDYKLRLL
jgi:hypothetical protein